MEKFELYCGKSTFPIDFPLIHSFGWSLIVSRERPYHIYGSVCSPHYYSSLSLSGSKPCMQCKPASSSIYIQLWMSRKGTNIHASCSYRSARQAKQQQLDNTWFQRATAALFMWSGSEGSEFFIFCKLLFSNDFWHESILLNVLMNKYWRNYDLDRYAMTKESWVFSIF